MDPALAPEGHDTLTVAVPVGHVDDVASQDWSTIRVQARQAVLRRLAEIGLADLDTHIKFEVSFTPRDWQRRYNLVKGATHGLSHDLLQMAYFRRRPSYRSQHPGFSGAARRR